MKIQRGAIALTFLLSGCATLPHAFLLMPKAPPGQLVGKVELNAPYRLQATAGEVVSGATVSLMDPTTGNTLSSAVTDASGNFTLNFPGLSPTPGSFYTLEAVKGLAVGAGSNRAGAAAVRLRSLLEWNGGWNSLTGGPIVVSAASTALSDIVSLKQNNGSIVPLAPLMNTLSGSTFTEAGTGLTNAHDFGPVLSLVQQAIQLDEDPLAVVAFNPASGQYQLTIGSPLIGSLTPSIPTPGGTLSVTGAYFDNSATGSYWLGSVQAASWVVSADRETATISIATSAYSAPLTYQRPNGSVQTLSSYLMLHGTVGTLAGNGALSFSDGSAGNAEFKNPTGVVMGRNGILYIADQHNNCVRTLLPTGQVSTLAGNGTAGTVDGLGTAAEFNQPSGLALDATGILYVSEFGGNVIRKVTLLGAVTTLAGSGAAASVDGTGPAASFNVPYGLAVDATGDLYVTENGGNCIREVTPAGVVTTIAGSGALGNADGVGTAAVFSHIYGGALDANGSLYVTDSNNNSIRRVDLASKAVTTLAGGSLGSADGTATAAQFSFPLGIVDDALGNLYVTDYNGALVRKVTLGGVVTTLAGTGVTGFANGLLLGSQFSKPSGLCFDAWGNLLVADYANNQIRSITP